MTKYKSKRLYIIAANIITIIICLILDHYKILGLLPGIVIVGCTFGIMIHSLNLLFNYNEEEKSLTESVNDTGKSFGVGLANGLSRDKRNKS